MGEGRSGRNRNFVIKLMSTFSFVRRWAYAGRLSKIQDDRKAKRRVSYRVESYKIGVNADLIKPFESN